MLALGCNRIFFQGYVPLWQTGNSSQLGFTRKIYVLTIFHFNQNGIFGTDRNHSKNRESSSELWWGVPFGHGLSVINYEAENRVITKRIYFLFDDLALLWWKVNTNCKLKVFEFKFFFPSIPVSSIDSLSRTSKGYLESFWNWLTRK